MADIEIERSHALNAEDLRLRLVTVEQKLQERYGVTLSWQGNEANVKGTGVTGTLALMPAAVKVSLKLGFMVKPFASKIRETMERQLDKALA